MKQSKKFLLIMTVCVLGLSLLTGGCQTSKKPMTPTDQKPNLTTPANPNKTSTGMSEARQMATKIQNEAKMVTGVRNATAVVSGRTIYIGLDLNANLGKEQSTKVEKDVLDRTKKMASGYTVMVSSDIDTVTRIKKVAQGIAAGKPLSTFSKEIQDIGDRMKPRMK